MTRARSFAALSIAIALTACAGPGSRPESTAGNLTALESYYAAINRRDLLAMPAYVAPDVIWCSMIGSERIVEVESRDALIAAFETYFARFADTSAEIADSLTAGDMTAVLERTRWSDGEIRGQGERIGVFEFADGRIVRITYFLPAEQD